MEFLKEYWFDLCLVFGGAGAWLFERHKRVNTKVDTGQKLISMYQSAMNDFEKRYDKKFKALESKIENQQKELDSWKRKYSSLKREFDNYRQKHV